MRPVSVGSPTFLEDPIKWAERALRDIEVASNTPTPVSKGGTAANEGRLAQANLGGWYVLAASAVQSQHTGNTSETTLKSVTVPAGAMGPNGVLRITAVCSCTNDADDKTFRVKLGATTFATFLLTASASNTFQITIANRNAANAQVSGGAEDGTSGFGPSTTAVATGTIDTTADAILLISGQLEDGADAIRIESWLVELLYQP